MAESTTPDIDQPTESPPARPRFVPEDFVVPVPPRTKDFWLEPLGEQHNEADYAAWMSSIEHIHATPGFPDGDWPHEMSLAENAGDLRMHARHFEERRGFTYTVRSALDDDVIGCVYIYPNREASSDVDVSSWVRASHAELDADLWSTVSAWLQAEWPFPPEQIRYAAR